VQLEQPHAALKFFKDAADLGVPEAELARDRGLAYDIAGDPRRAQRDYRLALQRSRDPELTRRLALSLAISGEREPALRLLDEQLQSRNPAAERTRALVLALTGDAADASRAVEASMPGPQGEALMPFLARLPSLSLADRALAVHLGRFPQDGRSAPAQTYAMNSFRSNVVPASPNSSLTAGRPDPLQPGLGRSTATLVRSAPPEAADDQQAPPVRMQGGPPRSGSQMEMGVRRQPGAAPSASHAPLIALPHPLDIRRPAQAGDQVAPPVSHPPVPRQSRLADLAATVATLPGSTPAASTSPSPSPSAAAVPVAQQERVAAYGPKVPAAAAPAKAAPPAAKPEPKIASRQWVQLGIGADQDTLPDEYKRLKARGGKLLAALGGWTAPMGETNRILVGPFASKDDAQEFVNQLAEKNVRAFTWTSRAGEKVSKLPAK